MGHLLRVKITWLSILIITVVFFWFFFPCRYGTIYESSQEEKLARGSQGQGRNASLEIKIFLIFRKRSRKIQEVERHWRAFEGGLCFT